MSGSNDYHADLARMDAWLRRNSDVECAALFDIGTRAARVLVGPKNPLRLEYWDQSFFVTVGFVPDLGADVHPMTHVLDVNESRALRKLCKFIVDAMNVLHRNRILDSNIVAIGTEVFRIMPDSNRAEVTAWIEKETGLRLQVIDGEHEAGLSLSAANFTYDRGLEDPSLLLDYLKHERLLLIDQGGGSTEVSFLETNSGARSESEGGLGTTTLQRMFFEGEGPDPESNFLSIREQYELILSHIQKYVDAYKHLRPGTFKLAYALGTAISDCIPGLHKREIHNKILTADLILSVEQQRCSELELLYPTVAALYKDLRRLKRAEDDRYVRANKSVLFLYGLPVYRMILQKIDLSELRLCGYPLRYGAFLVWHAQQMGWDNRPRVT